jgi:prepilin-type N-terminal cleavage/methylation domain-containing protein
MVPRSVQAGFSLIELLVALSIFTVVVTMSTGTLLVLIDANAKAQNIQAVMNNLTFALDSMTREIRTGYSYHCSAPSTPGSPASVTIVNDCNGTPGTLLQIVEGGNSLTGTGNPRIGFFYDNDYYGASHGAILRRVGTGSWFPITSADVRITDMQFVVTGSARGLTNPTQPTVTIFIAGRAGDQVGLESDFNIQASVVQRILDI